MNKILLTGFEAFGKEVNNPPADVAIALDGECRDGHQISSAILPVVQQKSLNQVIQLIDEINPHIIISLGLAALRQEITLEKAAINLEDYPIPDNEGNQPFDTPVVKDAANAYFSTLALKAMSREMTGEGLPVSISYSAGTYVCNHLFYGVLHHINRNDLPIRAGFIHVPQLQASELPALTNAIRFACKTAALFENDFMVPGGKLD